MKEVSISEERPIFCCYKVVSKDNRVAALMPVGVDSTANGLLPRTIEARLDVASNYIYVGDQRVFWYKYGFVSDETYKTAQFVVTKEWVRRVDTSEKYMDYGVCLIAALYCMMALSMVRFGGL
jgi:hypothetical protein